MARHDCFTYIPAYRELAVKVLRETGLSELGLERQNFPDGEAYLRITEDVKDKDIWILGGTVTDAATLEIYDLVSGVVAEGCRKVTVLLPYFGYSTMERAAKPGEVVKAKCRAKLLSSCSRPPGGLKFVLLDLHTEGLPYYFENDVQTEHVRATTLVKDVIRAWTRQGDFVVASVDAGRAKQVQKLAGALGADSAFAFKKRISGSTSEVMASGRRSVEGRNVVIYDDMIRTGDSILRAADVYKNAGALDIFAIATHGVFSSNALERLRSSGLISKVACTDSHPNALIQKAGPFLEVVSLDKFFSGIISGISPAPGAQSTQAC